jgi:NADP-dependent 3-hydroxy acid dehydrogenase YdfG
LWGRDAERLAEAAEQSATADDRPAVDQFDLTDHQLLARAVNAAVERGPLRVVVLAAGLFDWGPADAADPERWSRLLEVNLTSAAVTTRLVLPHLIEAAPSALIYLGSGASHQTFANNAAYVASKHGIAGLAGSVFHDVRDRDVKVSLISPGLVAAGAGGLSPAGQTHPELLLAPADVAAAVRFVVTFPVRGCPTQVHLQPQRNPN